MNYYNEWDPKAAAWLRELIKAGHIPAGDMDERSIIDVKPNELRKYTQCHFFAGIGGWSYALRLAGWPAGRPAWTGSCPCQPLSCAGSGKGHADGRHLWPAFYALIAECRPPTVFGEQVAGKAGIEWFAGIRADLEGIGYAVGGADLCAAGVGKPHRRQRLFWVANSISKRGCIRQPAREHAMDVDARGEEARPGRICERLATEPMPRPLAHGIPDRVGLLRGYGNAIVPALAAEFIQACEEAIAGPTQIGVEPDGA